MRLKKYLTATRSAVAGWLPDGMMLAGFGSVSYGCGLVYVPAGFIVGGGLLLLAGVVAARRGD